MEWDNDFSNLEHLKDRHEFNKKILALAVNEAYPGRIVMDDGRIVVAFEGDHYRSVSTEYPAPAVFKRYHPVLETCNRYAIVTTTESGHYVNIDYDIYNAYRVVKSHKEAIQNNCGRIEEHQKSIDEIIRQNEKYEQRIEEIENDRGWRSR